MFPGLKGNTMIQHPLPWEVIEAFHVMWDNFPEPVSLVHKSREVLAVNKAHFLEPGMFCSKTGLNGPHVGCLANKALAEQAAVAVLNHSPFENKHVIGYWIPLDGHPDYFIHTGVRFSVDFENETCALSPLTDEAKEKMSYYQPTGEYRFRK